MKKCYSKDLRTNILDAMPVDIGSKVVTENGILYIPEYTASPYAGYAYKNIHAENQEIAYIPEQSFDNYDARVKEAVQKKIPFTGLFDGYTRKQLLRQVDNNEEILEQMLGELCYEDPSTWYESYLRDIEEN